MVKNSKYNIIKIINECSKCNVKRIIIDNIEIEFKDNSVAIEEIVEPVVDVEFNKEADNQKKEIEEMTEQLEEENFICNDFEAYEEKAIKELMRVDNAK